MKLLKFKLRSSTTLKVLPGFATIAVWIITYFRAISIELTPTGFLLLARGYCRVVPEQWYFVKPYPGASGWVFFSPIQSVVEFAHKSTVAAPMWIVALFNIVIPFWLWRRRSASTLTQGFPAAAGDNLVARKNYATVSIDSRMPLRSKLIVIPLGIILGILGFFMVALVVNAIVWGIIALAGGDNPK